MRGQESEKKKNLKLGREMIREGLNLNPLRGKADEEDFTVSTHTLVVFSLTDTFQLEAPTAMNYNLTPHSIIATAV